MNDLTTEEVQALDFTKVGRVENAVDPDSFRRVIGFEYKGQWCRVTDGPAFQAFLEGHRKILYNAKVYMTKTFWEDLQEKFGVPFPDGYEVEYIQGAPDHVWIYYKSYLRLPHDRITETMFSIKEIYSDDELIGFVTKFRRVE